MSGDTIPEDTMPGDTPSEVNEVNLGVKLYQHLYIYRNGI